MSLKPNSFVTSLNSLTSAYITREEVIQGISSIVPALSTLNLSSFFFQDPNPKFSSVAVNASGQITGFAPIQTSNVILNGASGLNQAGNLRLGQIGNIQNAALCSADNNGNMAPLRANSIYATGGGVTGFAAGWTFNNTGFGVFNASASTTSVLGWAFGNANTINLQNISSINGAPVNANPTTYTNLSGNNITNSQVIGTPSLINVSSINGSNITTFANSQTWVPYTVTATGASNITFTANTQAQCLAFTGIPIVAFGNRAINISVPITVTPISNLATPINVTIQAFLGGATTGGTAVQQQLSFVAGQGTGNGRTITLAGTCICNGPSANLIIAAVVDQNVTLTFQQGSGSFNRFFFQQII
jgi:hypothetical protein